MPLSRFTPILTDRLRLRPMRSDDAHALWVRRNEPSTARFQGWELPYSLDTARALAESVDALDCMPPADGWFQITVEDLHDDAVIGDLALHLTFGARCAEIGYTLSASARGRGLATEAAQALVAWLVDVVGVTRVAASMDPENLGSVRVAERIGMVFEGYSLNSYWVGDRNTDAWHFAMTPDQWRSWEQRPVTAPTTLRLDEITGSNVRTVLDLATHRSQERLVSPVDRWFGVVHAPDEPGRPTLKPWIRAIVADDEIVGALLMSQPDDDGAAMVWRLMVDRMHQQRGIGRAALELAVASARSWSARSLVISWCDVPGTAGPLYLDYGFVPTGEMIDGEVVARLEL